jgi:hypothetical protein
MLAAGTPWPSSSPARRLRLPSATTVATRSPAPASPANVSSCPPRRRENASTSAKTLPAAAPAAFGPARWAVYHIARRYESETGVHAHVFDGSGPGAEQTGVVVLHDI